MTSPRKKTVVIAEKELYVANRKEMKRVMFQAGEDAKKILLRYFGKIDSVVKKGVVDLVTVADKKAEEAIIRRVQGAFPDHDILGEESGAVGAASGGGRAGKAAEYCWVVDPLDGTTNFAHANPYFSVSIGLTQKGETVMGLVVDVTREEWFFAERGGGAFLYKNRLDGTFERRKRIRVSKVKKLEDSLIFTGFPHCRREYADRLLDVVEALLMRTHGVIRMGSAAIDLCSVACGRTEAFYEPSLNPWDMAAGNLIVEEAGGRATDYAGNRLKKPGRHVVATNGHIHRALLRVIHEKWGKKPEPED